MNQHFSGPGGIVHSPASQHSKEMATWETRPLDNGSVTQAMIDQARRAGVHHGAFAFQEFPKSMFKAEQTPTGIKITDMSRTAQSDVEQRNLESRGYRATQEAAIAYVEAQNFAAGEAAANRAFHDRRMSETARREAEEIDNSTARHLGEIPAAPLKKRGRPVKTEAPAVEA